MEQQHKKSGQLQKSGKSTTDGRSGSTKIAKLVSRDISENLGKLPPQALDMEEAVLGAMMLERNAVMLVVDLLHGDDFYTEQHNEIFQAMVDLYRESKPVDMRTVVAQLRKNGRLEIVGGAFYIAELTSRVSSAANIEYHARIIQEYSIRRKIINLTSQYQQDAYEDTIDIFDLLEKYDQNHSDMINPFLKGKLKDAKTILANTFQNILARKTHNGVTGVASGFLAVDRITAGWQPSELIIVAARPGMGKTAFILSAALNSAVRFKIPTLFFSLEMSELALGDRIAAITCEVDLANIIRNKLPEGGYDDMLRKTKDVAESPLYIDDTAALHVFELRARAKRAKNEHNIQLIIVDYMQLMQGDKRGNREQEIASISSGLKQMAKDLKIPVIALSQLSRGVESRGGDKRPMLSDLRESGSIEQDADVVMFLYRPEYYGIKTDEKGNSTTGQMEGIIAKHRQGGLENVALKFIGRYTKVVDWTEVPSSVPPNFVPVSQARQPFRDDSSGSTDDLPF